MVEDRKNHKHLKELEIKLKTACNALGGTLLAGAGNPNWSSPFLIILLDYLFTAEALVVANCNSDFSEISTKVKRGFSHRVEGMGTAEFVKLCPTVVWIPPIRSHGVNSRAQTMCCGSS